MTRIICDHCRKEVEPDSYGFAPLGWLHVHRRGVYANASSDYCSATCAETALAVEARAASLEAALAEAPSASETVS